MIRDPRVEPMAGDILEIEPGCCVFRHVVGYRNGMVTFASRCGNQWLNTTFRSSIDEWRSEMENARLTHIGGAA